MSTRGSTGALHGLMLPRRSQNGGPAVLRWAARRLARLFELLPPRMPLVAKYRLIESLWQHVGPSSKKRIRIGLHAEFEQVVATVRDHVDAVVTHYRIPDQLERRFTWLSAGDAGVKQDLLNHLQKMERDLAVQSALMTVPVLMEHLKADASNQTHRVAQILRIGKHELEVLFDRNATGVTLQEPIATTAKLSKNAVGRYWWLLIVGGVILWIVLRSQH
jgi:hypothetical protein